MSINAGRAKLKQASKDLQNGWLQVKSNWQDDNSRKFAENHLNPLLAKLRAAQSALGHMEAILNRARHDCE